MKKLLLVSLLAMGATSFAASEIGSATEASMPIRMKAVIEDTAEKEDGLVITDPTNSGLKEIELDFGNFTKGIGGSQTRSAEVVVTKANGQPFSTAKTATFAVKKLDGGALSGNITVAAGVEVALKVVDGKSTVTAAAGAEEIKSEVTGTMTVATEAAAANIDDKTKAALFVTIADA